MSTERIETEGVEKSPDKQKTTLSQKIISLIVKGYFRYYHRLTVALDPNTLDHGPALFLMAHFSHLDAALEAADPIKPPTIPVVKRELMRVPGIGWALRQLGAIPVARDEKDIAGVRRIFEALEKKRAVCIAPEGTRNKTGRLGPMNAIAVAIALKAHRKGIPLLPIVALGTDKALPPGCWIPRPTKIEVFSGPPINLSEWSSKRLRGKALEPPARVIRASIAALLPERNQPLPGTPALAG
jgi:1-acyl-sn-glycerol-3-phosphate acyltransferase